MSITLTRHHEYEHRTSNIERRTLNQSDSVRHWVLNVRCSMFIFFIGEISHGYASYPP